MPESELKCQHVSGGQLQRCKKLSLGDPLPPTYIKQGSLSSLLEVEVLLFGAITPQFRRGGRLYKALLRNTNQVQKFPVKLITGAVIAKEICLGGARRSFFFLKHSCLVAFATPIPKTFLLILTV